MKIEYEVKILDIDFNEIKNKLEKLSAEYIWEVEQKRYVYDFNPINPNKWIRLRQKWEKVELTIKEITDDSITWTREIETSVGDFETTNSILEELWYKAKAYQENKRISYKLDGVEIELDFWPKIPLYMEIEWKNEEEVKNMVEKLWYKMSDTTSINTTKVYAKYGINLGEIKDLRF
jgi:adenylate cyclase class 2